MTDKVVLCGANSYEQKYYFNEEFQSLPQSVKDELHIMCVLFTEDVGGILTMEYDEKGNLDFQVIFFLGENVDWGEEKEDQEGDDKGETDEV